MIRHLEATLEGPHSDFDLQVAVGLRAVASATRHLTFEDRARVWTTSLLPSGSLILEPVAEAHCGFLKRTPSEAAAGHTPFASFRTD